MAHIEFCSELEMVILLSLIITKKEFLMPILPFLTSPFVLLKSHNYGKDTLIC